MPRDPAASHGVRSRRGAPAEAAAKAPAKATALAGAPAEDAAARPDPAKGQAGGVAAAALRLMEQEPELARMDSGGKVRGLLEKRAAETPSREGAGDGKVVSAPDHQATKLEALTGLVLGMMAKRTITYSVLIFLLGLVWVTLFPLVCITTGELKCRGTYFSENALSPGVAKTAISLEERAALVRSEESLRELASDASQDEGVQHLVQLLHQSSIRDTFVLHSNESGIPGTTVQGVLWPKAAADRRESIVLVVRLPTQEMRLKNQGTHACCSGASVALVLAEALSRVQWMSKNVVFVFAENGAAVRHWAKTYHSFPPGTEAMSRPGAIIGGLVLDLAEGQGGLPAHVPSIELLLQGINGQLPNLDLVNVVNELFSRTQHYRTPRIGRDSRVTRELQAQARKLWGKLGQDMGYKSADTIFMQWSGNFENLVRFMRDTCFGPSGWHGYLLPYNIHALTIAVGHNEVQSPYNSPTTSGKASGDILQVVEQTFRSLSNLEEKFHQSYFLYLLPGNKMFVSIGEYLGSLIFALAPLWLGIVSFSTRKQRSDAKDVVDDVAALVDGALSVSIAIACGLFLFAGFGRSWTLVASIFLAGQVLNTSHWHSLPVARRARAVQSAKAQGAMLLFIAHLVIGMVNYPFALLSAVTNVPFYAVAQSVCDRKRGALLRAAIAATWLLTLVGLASWLYLVPHDVAWLENHTAGLHLETLPETVARAYDEIGLMFWPYATLILFPAHLLCVGFVLA